MSSRLGVNASPEVCGDSGATSPLCAAGTLYTAALTALYVSLSKDGPDLCYSGRATQWEFLANFYGATGEEDFCVSVCSATDSLWKSDVLLLGSKSEKKKKAEWECTSARKRKKKDFFLKRINLQSTRRWSISVWLNRWLLISMVTRWSVLRCQPAIGAGSCEQVCGCWRSRRLHLIAGAKTLQSLRENESSHRWSSLL